MIYMLVTAIFRNAPKCCKVLQANLRGNMLDFGYKRSFLNSLSKYFILNLLIVALEEDGDSAILGLF